MKKRSMISLYGTGILVGLGMGLLIGCTQKDVDYNIENVTEEIQTEADNRKSGVAQFEEASSWNETWQLHPKKGEAVQVKVEADILLPKTNQMSVIEVAVPEFDAEYKERIAKLLYKNEAVYYHDYAHLTKGELEEMYTMYEEWYASYSEEERKELEGRMEECQAALEKAADTHTLAEEYNINEYIGARDGIPFQLTFMEYYDEQEENLTGQRLDFYAEDFYAICSKQYEGYTRCMEHPYVSDIENECGITEAEAEKLARKFVDDLGLEYPVLAYTKPLLWGDDTLSSVNCNEWSANGYVFHYEYGIDGISLTGMGSQWGYLDVMNWQEEEPYSMKAEANVYVTEQGVIQLHMSNPVETTGILESVELLPLETIQGIMKEQMEKQYEDFHFMELSVGELLFTHMELIYFRVRDKENPGCYSYVPAWRLSNLKEPTGFEYGSITNPVIVNAIDGSLIDYYDET